MEALISAQNGLAIVVDGTSVLSIHADAPERDVLRQSHEVRWLLGGTDDVIVLEGAHREDVVERLQWEQKRQLALMLVSCVLDGDPAVSVDIRQEAAMELEELLQESQVKEDLRNILWSVPSPSSADFVGPQEWLEYTTPGTKRLLGALAESQSSIADVRKAWDSLPESLFVDGAGHWKQEAIRLGLFRQVVDLHRRFKAWTEHRAISFQLPSIGALLAESHSVVELHSGGVDLRLQQWIRSLLHQEPFRQLSNYYQVMNRWLAALEDDRESPRPPRTQRRSRPLVSEVRESPAPPYGSEPPEDED